MKAYRVVLLGAVIVAGSLLAGGCVSQAKYNEALAQNRRAQDALQASQSQVENLREENKKLADQLTARDNLLQARQRDIALLEKARDGLRKDFAALDAAYKKLLARGTGGIVLPPELNRALQDLVAKHSDLMEYVPKYGMVKFKSDMTFASGSDNVNPEAKEALDKLVKILDSPEAKEFSVYIAGHTDNVPISKPTTRRRHPTNWYLSVHRAVAVQQVMESAGLAPKRIGVMGFGEYHPVAPNAPGKKGNVLNRRVEIWIVPPDRLLTVDEVQVDAVKTDESK